MKKVFLIILVILSFFSGNAQEKDVIKVMQYNLLNYGNNTGYCNTTNNNVNDKNEYIKTILNAVKPDILTVNEFASNTTLLNDFVSNVLNVNGITYWQTTPIINQAHSSLINSIFYNSQKMTLKKHRIAQTYVRDIDVYELYFNTENLIYGDTVTLICVVGHLKAGQTSEDENKRKLMTQNTLNFLNNNYRECNVLFMGDFNLYSSSEGAYQTMTNSSTYPFSYFIDPVGSDGVGDWNNNSRYADYHTQSTNSYGNDCRSGGGMDDRFDFIMMSPNISAGRDHIRYVSDSYHPLGQDGRHFNKSINSPANSAVSQSVADALYNNSDHLPIIMELNIDEKISVNELSQNDLDVKVYPNPADDNVNVMFFQKTPGKVTINLFNTLGQLSLQEEEVFESGENNISVSLGEISKGFYLMKVTAADGSSKTIKLIIK